MPKSEKPELDGVVGVPGRPAKDGTALLVPVLLVPLVDALPPTIETDDSGISIAPSTSCGVEPDMSTAVTIALLAMVDVIAVPSDAVAATLSVYWPSGSWLPLESWPFQAKSLLPCAVLPLPV